MCTHKIFFACFLILLACSSDKDDPIASEFSVYTERFNAEVKARGYNLDITNLSVRFADASELAGNCGYGYTNPPRIEISNSDGCWHNRTDTEKEILMFHEMGHSILNRQHLNDTLPNGDYKSMMFGGNQFIVYYDFTPEKRKYYLDELFDPSTPIPDWAAAKTTTVEIHNDSINRLTSTWNFTKGTGANHEGLLNDKIFSSPGHSLSINSTLSSGSFSYWTYTFNSSKIPVSAQVMLKVKIKVADVTGAGVYFAMLANQPNNSSAFVTTQGINNVIGTKDFMEYKLKLNYFPDNTKEIFIFLIMDGSATGTAYFDDISLSYRK